MQSIISTLKIIIKNKITNRPLSGVKINWIEIPDNIKHANSYCKRFKHSEDGLQVNVTNEAGYCLLHGELNMGSHLLIYLHGIICKGFKELRIEKSIEGGYNKEFIVFLYPDN